MIPLSLIRNLGIDESEFNFQFQSHSNYPSALALSDTLNFLGVDNSAYELEKEYWNEIPTDFITLYNQKFGLVKKELKLNKYSIFSDQNLLINEENLLKNSTNLVILLNNENRVNKKPQRNIWFPIVFLALLAFIVASFNFSWSILFYNFLSLTGAYISYEIFKEKFGTSSPVLNTICGKVDSESNCNKVISSDKTNILGLKLSDISLVYFIGLFLIGTFIVSLTPVLLTISAFASSIILYSLYIQIFVEKKLCKVCLTIITILLLQLLVAYLYLNSGEFSLKEIAISAFIFATILFATSLYNKLVLKNNELRKSNIKNLKFKRNYHLFKKQLLDAEQTIFQNNQSSFFLGDYNAKIHISLISNPFCGYCKEAHNIIERILEKYSGKISVQVRFNYTTENKDDNLTIVLSHFKNIYENFGESVFLQQIGEWFSKRNLESLKEESLKLDIDLSEEVQVGQENIQLGFNFTPIFLINGYRFPQSYDREDIFYFIDELIEDEDLLIKKIAEAEKLTE